MNTEISSYVDSILDKWSNNGSSLISILLDIQSKYNYLPKDALIKASKRLNIPLIQVYSVATFYKSFSLKPRGKHLITVCLGTACHVRGGARILEKLEQSMDITAGRTTEDQRYTLERVNCLGCCALGPVITINEDTHGRLSVKDVDGILEGYE